MTKKCFFNERLTRHRRNRKISLFVAVPRKLMVTLNAVVCNRIPWQPLMFYLSTHTSSVVDRCVENIAHIELFAP